MINLRKVPIWLWVTLTLILLLIGLTVANAYVRLGKSNMVFDFVSVFDVSSQSEESIELDYQEGMTLAVNSEGGDITVIGSDRKDIQVDMVKTGWGDNTSSAKQVAENLEVTVEESGNRKSVV